MKNLKTKNILISAYEGEVYFTNFPNHFNREKLINLAMYHINQQRIEEGYHNLTTSLNNVSYDVNPFLYDMKDHDYYHDYKNAVAKSERLITIDYEDYSHE